MWWRGVRDACQAGLVVRALRQDAAIRTLMWKAVRLNVLCFAGLNVVVSFIMFPLFETWIAAGSETEMQRLFVQFLYYFMTIVFNVFFLFPIYVSTVISNSDYYFEIAQRVEKMLPTELKPVTTAPPPRWQDRGADTVYERLIVLSFLIITAPLYFVPYIGTFLYFSYCCWCYGYYCFGYTWLLRRTDWNLENRLNYFELHWVYFLGFGTPFTVLLWYFPLVVGLGIYAVLFPIFVAMAQASTPKRAHSTNRLLPHRISIFYEAKLLANLLLHLLHKCFPSSPAPPNPSAS
uniref:Etoposide-induced protein 2.4 n=1 Tax=Arcella intermedia TaxID=1963864 RepID=A0A6B2LBM2_9EUKA